MKWKWLKKKQKEITESIVGTAEDVLKSRSHSIVSNGQEKLSKLFPTIALGILAWEVLGGGPSSAGYLKEGIKEARNFTVYIGSVKVTLH